MKTLLCAATLSLACTCASLAETCPDWDLPDPSDQARFCRMLNDILHAPHQNTPVRGHYPSRDLPPELKAVLEGEPLMAEAYNSSSQRTLDLIRLIRESGGTHPE